MGQRGIQQHQLFPSPQPMFGRSPVYEQPLPIVNGFPIQEECTQLASINDRIEEKRHEVSYSHHTNDIAYSFPRIAEEHKDAERFHHNNQSSILPVSINSSPQTIVRFKKKRTFTRIEKETAMLNIAETNQSLFSMLIKQQNKIMSNQRREHIANVNEEVTQEKVLSPLRCSLKPEYKNLESSGKPRKKFKQAWELGLQI